jgi:hypothetical protein
MPGLPSAALNFMDTRLVESWHLGGREEARRPTQQQQGGQGHWFTLQHSSRPLAHSCCSCGGLFRIQTPPSVFA